MVNKGFFKKGKKVRIRKIYCNPKNKTQLKVKNSVTYVSHS